MIRRFVGSGVRYRIGGKVSGAYALPGGITSVSVVSFRGHSDLSELKGTVWDANLVRDASGAEYANFEEAKADAQGPLSPLWLSTWSLSGGSGTVDVTDPLGLMGCDGVPMDGKMLIASRRLGDG